MSATERTHTHARALHPVDDALRQNEITLGRRMVLRSRCSDCAWRPIGSWTRSSEPIGWPPHASPDRTPHRHCVRQKGSYKTMFDRTQSRGRDPGEPVSDR